MSSRPAPPPSLGQVLTAALSAADAGDLAGMEAAVCRGVEACARLQASGSVPPAGELRELKSLQHAVLERATAERERLGREIERAARSRRARAAYARR